MRIEIADIKRVHIPERFITGYPEDISDDAVASTRSVLDWLRGRRQAVDPHTLEDLEILGRPSDNWIASGVKFELASEMGDVRIRSVTVYKHPEPGDHDTNGLQAIFRLDSSSE